MVLINRKIICEEKRVGWNVGQWKWAEFEGVNWGTPEMTTRGVRLLLDYERVFPTLLGRSQLSLRLLCQDPFFGSAMPHTSLAVCWSSFSLFFKKEMALVLCLREV